MIDMHAHTFVGVNGFNFCVQLTAAFHMQCHCHGIYLFQLQVSRTDKS
jgi:hypothetical protein